MSFYNTQTPDRFVVQAPEVLNAQNVQFLLSGFNQPTYGTSSNAVTTASNQTYTSSNLINGYIARSGAGTFTDTLPLGADLITALNNNQSIRANNQLPYAKGVQVGFNFSVAILNSTGNTLTIQGNTGLTLKGTTQTIANGAIGVFQVYITSSTTAQAVLVA